MNSLATARRTAPFRRGGTVVASNRRTRAFAATTPPLGVLLRSTGPSLLSYALGQLAKIPLLAAAAALGGVAVVVWLERRGGPVWLVERLALRQPLGLTAGTQVSLLVLGLAATFGPGRRVLTHLETLVHELGHAAAAVVVGGTPTGLTLRLDGSGEANWLKPGSLRRLRLLPVTFAGYWAPSAVALALVEATRRGFGVELLNVLSVCGAVAALLLARCLWSAVVSLTTTVSMVLLWHTTGAGILPGRLSLPGLGALGPQSGRPWAALWPDGGTVAALAMALVLAGGAVRSSIVQARLVRLDGSDAHQAGWALHLPARPIAWIQALGCIAVALSVTAHVAFLA
jgi:hypothetical protein